MPSEEYDNTRMRLRFEARERNVERAGHGEAMLTGSADGNPHDSGSHGELSKCHHAGNADVQFSFYASSVADSS
jgi:hypothetical protein